MTKSQINESNQAIAERASNALTRQETVGLADLYNLLKRNVLGLLTIGDNTIATVERASTVMDQSSHLWAMDTLTHKMAESDAAIKRLHEI